MKKCTLCQVEKSLDEFPKRSRAKDGHQSRCFVCQRQLMKQHYKDNQAYYLNKQKKRKEWLKESNFILLYEYFSTHSCVDCGETDPIVLEFDHLRDKRANVSDMILRYEWSVIIIEIEKCEVVCGNCHKRRTAKQQGWRKLGPIG